MKIRLSCANCYKRDSPATQGSYRYAPLQEDPLYEFKCSLCGENTTILVMQRRFEVLFDIAVTAFVDGYPREGVSSASSSLERFYEFVIRVITRKNGIPQSHLSELWKLVSNQSERQLGAFIFLWSIFIKTPPPILDRKKVELRNKVVHKGRIPTDSEAQGYICHVFKLLRRGIIELKRSEFNSDINREIDGEWKDAIEQSKRLKGEIAQRSLIVTTFNLVNSADLIEALDFQEELEGFRRWNSVVRSHDV